MKFTATLLVMMRPAVSVDTEHSDQHVTTRRNVATGYGGIYGLQGLYQCIAGRGSVCRRR
jgi:hypothetical protein